MIVWHSFHPRLLMWSLSVKCSSPSGLLMEEYWWYVRVVQSRQLSFFSAKRQYLSSFWGNIKSSCFDFKLINVPSFKSSSHNKHWFVFRPLIKNKTHLTFKNVLLLVLRTWSWLKAFVFYPLMFCFWWRPSCGHVVTLLLVLYSSRLWSVRSFEWGL